MTPADEKRMAAAMASTEPLFRDRGEVGFRPRELPVLKWMALRGDAMAPQRMTPGAVGYDLFSVQSVPIWPGETVVVGTGVAVEIPPGYEGQIRGRSSLARDGVITHLGTIDADFRGELRVVLSKMLRSISTSAFKIEPGDRIAQLVISPVWTGEVVQVQELGETARGAGGFGSTGRGDVKYGEITLSADDVAAAKRQLFEPGMTNAEFLAKLDRLVDEEFAAAADSIHGPGKSHEE